jgi:hypothetical protein
MLVSQQLEELGTLAALICSQVGVSGPYTKEEHATLNLVRFRYVVTGHWRQEYLRGFA